MTRAPSASLSPEKRLSAFIARYSPEVAAVARAALKKMRVRLPGAIELVYDNYNALAVGFGPSERASEAIFSLAVFPKWVTLCFLQGAKVPDPDNLLNGDGNQVRHIRLVDPELLLSPAIRVLMLAALDQANVPISPYSRHRVIIKSISAKQRPRR